MAKSSGKILSVEISSISADPANVRKHDRRSIEAIAASLRRFGQQKPIVIDAKGVCRAGNGTLAAAKSMGWKTIDAVRTDLTGAELAAYAIADNRTSDLSEFDDELLRGVLSGLEQDGVLLADIGFDDREQRNLLQCDDEMPGSEEHAATPGKFMILIVCVDEADQTRMLEELAAQGKECRALIQ